MNIVMKDVINYIMTSVMIDVTTDVMINVMTIMQSQLLRCMEAWKNETIRKKSKDNKYETNQPKWGHTSLSCEMNEHHMD